MRHRSFLAFVTCIVGLLLEANDALARPGGGGSYHGGGGGGGVHGGGGGGGGFHGNGGGSGIYVGGGSGGGGSISAFDLLVIVVVVVIFLIVASRRRGALDRGAYESIAAAESDETALIRGASLDSLLARDPALTLDSIVQRVHRMNSVLVSAWCAGDMRTARPFVSDGVYSRFQVQLGLMRGENRRNVMQDAAVVLAEVAGVESAAPLDVVHIRMTARARDVDVPVQATQAQIAHALARAPIGTYTEIWSLVRRHGARTTRDASALGSACPSCGAPIIDAQAGALPTVGEMIKCRYCGALLCSGEHDWVLAEITQVEEWHPHAGVPHGFDVVRARDPELTRESLEDRASYLFWRWAEASRAHNPGLLGKCATEAFLRERAHLDVLASSRDLAVGGADLVFLQEGDLDRAYVKIFWSAISGRGSEGTAAASVLRMTRKPGVVTRPGLTALLCRACGAPIGESETPTCDHCGALLTAGDDAWVLDAIEAPGVLESEAARDARTQGEPLPDWLVPKIADPRERMALFAQMSAMMAADGEISRSERRLLTMLGRRWGIPEQAIDARTSRGAGSMLGSPVAQPQWFLAGLVAAALADGKIDSRERAMLERACVALRLPPEELESQIRGYRSRMESQGSAS